MPVAHVEVLLKFGTLWSILFLGNKPEDQRAQCGEDESNEEELCGELIHKVLLPWKKLSDEPPTSFVCLICKLRKYDIAEFSSNNRILHGVIHSIQIIHAI